MTIRGVSRLILGACYIGAIFVFALIYTYYPGEFFHATLQHESALQAQFTEIKKDLSDALEKAYYELPSTHHWETREKMESQPAFPMKRPGRSHVWIVSTPMLEELTITDKVRFRSRVLYWDKDESPFPVAELHMWASFDVDDPHPKTFEEGKEYRELSVEFNPELNETLGEGEKRSEVITTVFGNGGMNIPIPLIKKIKAYRTADSRGVGSEIEGNYWRMFYFSAVTITTVGYGDIVPMTQATRLWVAVEAILGIVIIGLFISTISFKQS